MGFLQNINRVKKLLSGPNLQYLNRILWQVTDQTSETYNHFWSEFRKTYPGTGPGSHSTAAWNGLRELHAVVKKQIGEGGV